jgi:hypothetical protein
MAKTDISEQALAEATDEPPSVSPLTRRDYKRTAATQRQINTDFRFLSTSSNCMVTSVLSGKRRRYRFQVWGSSAWNSGCPRASPYQLRNYSMNRCAVSEVELLLSS